MKREHCDCCSIVGQKVVATKEVLVKSGSYQLSADEVVACLCDECFENHKYFEGE